MIENIIVCLLIALLIKTTKHKSILGWLVFSYYAIFILVDLEFYGFVISDLVFTRKLISWSVFTISISLFYSVLSSKLFLKGCNIAGLYALWLIINAIFTLVEAADTNNAYLVDLIYNIIQNMNLIVDLLVVILGTDNILHRTKGFGRVIDNTNNRIDNMCNKAFNFSSGSAICLER